MSGDRNGRGPHVRCMGVVAAGLLSLLAACGGNGGKEEELVDCRVVSTPECGDPLPGACDVLVLATVTPGPLVQRLLDDPPGSELCFHGEFGFAQQVTVGQGGLTLRAVESGAEWDFGDQQLAGASEAHGIRIDGAEGVRVEGLRILDPSRDAIHVTGSRDVRIRDVEIGWVRQDDRERGGHGIRVRGGSDVRVEGSRIAGAARVGVRISGTRRVVVRDNVVRESGVGLGFDNTEAADLLANEAFDNAVGALVAHLPGEGAGRRIRVRSNHLHDNNEPNPLGDSAAYGVLPAGAGLVSVAADEVEIADNEIRGNDSTGVLLASYFTLRAVGGGKEPGPQYDPYPETVHVTGNDFGNSGGAPKGLLAELPADVVALEDILWDGATNTDDGGTPSLCIQDNGDARFRNFNLDPQAGDLTFGDPRLDLAPHDCSHPELPPVRLQPANGDGEGAESGAADAGAG